MRYWLQFGRGCYAAETLIPPESEFRRAAASIRPRLLCRGNPSAAARPRSSPKLQFGRGCYAAETTKPAAKGELR